MPKMFRKNLAVGYQVQKFSCYFWL